MRGLRFELRPVELDDAAFVVALRTSAAGQFLNSAPSSVESQRAWLDAYFRREGDYCFVVQDVASGGAEGLIGLYNIGATSQQGEWGRWILRPGSMAATESALLIYRCAFERLMLQMVFCRTLVENRQVVSFHDSAGLQRMIEPVEILVDDRPRLAVEHYLRRESWPAVRTRLSSLAARWAARGS